METQIKTLIENTLNIPCYLDADTITYPSATVETYLENPELFGDGKAKGIILYLQVDLWYEDRTARDTATTTLTPLIEQAGFTYPNVHRYYDTTAKKYRATLKFSKNR